MSDYPRASRLGENQGEDQRGATTLRKNVSFWSPLQRSSWIKVGVVLMAAGLVLSSFATVHGANSTFYVSLTGNNADGHSWATAWNDLSHINWSAIHAGDTVLINAGTYASALVVGASGQAGAPITIRAQGKVIINGGRVLPLPDCDQASYTWQTIGVRSVGVDLGNASYVILDGGVWDGLMIAHHNQSGISLDNGSSHDTIENVEITDNGRAFHQGTGWRPDQPGVRLAGTNNTFDRVDIHDNGQDAFQSSGGIGNLTISNSWLYNVRPHPSNPALAYNFCMHSDGIQVYNGGVQSGVNIHDSILGPGLMQGTLLGQSGAGGSAEIDNVTLTNLLILDTTNANIMGYSNVMSQNWHMDHITSFHTGYDPDAGTHHALLLQGSGHSLSNSIFYGGDVYAPNGLSTSGNIQFNLTGTSVGTNQDPLFAGAPAYNSSPNLAILIAGDYSSASGKGSSLTSVSALLKRVAAPPTATPNGQPTQTSTPTQPGQPTQTGQPTQPGEPTRTPRPTATGTPAVSSAQNFIWLPVLEYFG